MDLKKITFPFPEILDKEVEQALDPVVTKLTVPAKTVLLSPNDDLPGIYYIHSGSTRHYTISMDGIEKIMYVLSRGWFFGEPSFFMQVKTGLYCTAETDVELWLLQKSKASEVFEKFSIIRETMFQCLTYKVLFLRHETESLCFNSCEERLLRTICMATDQSELIDQKWYGLKIQYTHYELGILIGSVRVTVSRLLNKLCSEDILRLVNHKIQINAKAYQECVYRFFEQYLL